jgi:molecular chaperone HscB
MNDYFKVFDLPRKLQVDVEALREKFYELSKRHHPDFHQATGGGDAADVLERSALVNRAYRTLREPMLRLAHGIALEEGQEDVAVKPKAPMDLLEEMLEVQEALEEAKASGLHGEATQRLVEQREALVARQAAGETAIIDRFAEWDRALEAGTDRTSMLVWFRQALAARAYLRTVIDDLNDALGEVRDTHVTHRRH